MIAKARLSSTNDLSAVKDWINQVYAETCVELEANVTTATMTLTANTASYTLSSSILRIKEMYVTPVGGVQTGPLQKTTLDYIIRKRQAAGGVPAATGYVTHYALLGINDFEVYPTPQAADVLTIWYVALPTALSANGDVSILQEPYSSKVLEYGALAEAADFKGDPAGDSYRQMYEMWKQKYRAHLTRKRGSQPGQFSMFPGNNFPPHDPSTDIGRYY